jgi:hypothetical protein
MLRSCALASARIIQFAPHFLARKQEQKVERLLARSVRFSPLSDCTDIPARLPPRSKGALPSARRMKPCAHFNTLDALDEGPNGR